MVEVGGCAVLCRDDKPASLQNNDRVGRKTSKGGWLFFFFFLKLHINDFTRYTQWQRSNTSYVKEEADFPKRDSVFNQVLKRTVNKITKEKYNLTKQ